MTLTQVSAEGIWTWVAFILIHKGNPAEQMRQMNRWLSWTREQLTSFIMPIKLDLKTPLRTTNALIMFVVVLITRFRHDADGFKVSGIHMQFSLFYYIFCSTYQTDASWCLQQKKIEIRLILQRFRNTSKKHCFSLKWRSMQYNFHLPSVCTDKTDVL